MVKAHRNRLTGIDIAGPGGEVEEGGGDQAQLHLHRLSDHPWSLSAVLS